MKKFSFWYLLLLVPFFLGLCIAFFEKSLYIAEKAVFSALRVLAPAFDIPFTVLTELGSAVGVIAITALIFIITLITKNHFLDFGLPVAVTTIVSRVINITLKNIIDRPRPDFKVLEASEASFPSGHAQNNMALYISILLVALLIVKSIRWRTVLKISMIALPIIIGLTRIYFGVHYLSDVIAGWGMGAFVAVFTNYIYFKIYYSLKEKKNAKA